jgi:trimeric autotransporter adhesin
VRCNMIRLLAGIAVGVVLAWSWKAGYRAADPAERQASLFDHRAFAYKDSKVDASSRSVDVRATVRQWAGQSEGLAEAALDAVTSFADLISFTSTAYAADATSVKTNSSGNTSGGPEGCSVVASPPPTQGETNSCSTNTAAGSNNGFAQCSTIDSNGSKGTTICSAYVTGSPTANMTCSISNGGTPTYCSATGTGTGGNNTVTCSTAGGKAVGNNENGNVSCSASGRARNNNSCSVKVSGTDAVNCSTFGGEHQACSAGNTTASKTATCSASGTAASGMAAMCSVLAGVKPTGADDNKCSAMAYANTAGTASCSTTDATTTGLCSVVADSEGAVPANTACTIIGGPGPEGNPNPPASYTCSANGTNEGGKPLVCSVISGGKVTSGPVTKGNSKSLCGGSVTGHGGKAWP